MGTFLTSEKLLLEEILQAAQALRKAIKGVSIGELIKLMRVQLGMSQIVLAKLSGVPQSTISRLEKSEKPVNVSTLQKIFKAMSCDLAIVPMPFESIDTIRRKQARKVAEKRIRYLKGTMNLEEQEPDPRFFEEHLKMEENQLLQGPSAKLWEEENSS